MIITIASNKGGVGKTTTTAELAASLIKKGLKRILIIDNDPQSDITRRLVDNFKFHFTLNDVYKWAREENNQYDISKAIVSTTWDNIDLVPAISELKFRENENDQLADYRLQIAIENFNVDIANKYDLILIDNAPAGGLLIKNSLIVSTHAIVITDPEPDGIYSASRMVKIIEQLKKRQNNELILMGILINRYQKNYQEHYKSINDLESIYKNLILKPYLPERAAIKNARGCNISVQLLSDKGAIEYQQYINAHAEKIINLIGDINNE